ncbi:DEAD/DEAH box helicase family protein, partial [PVC group bacterium]|nr:DEAD/DEAH box helicase family protein [PVC group bacterium]
MDEVQTRKEIVDLELGKRGWHHNNPSEVIIEFHMEKRFSSKAPISEDDPPYETKNEFADYLLLGRDGQTPLAVVEVKRTSKNARVGQRQAYGYADNILKIYGIDPFIFLTNGEAILFCDRSRYPPRKIYGFFERTDLERLKFLRENLDSNPSLLSVKHSIIDRDYQYEAVKRILERLEKGHRRSLLVMATGTGKTRTIMALIDVLIRAKWISNVLFLTDRKVLRDQAYGKKGFQGFFQESMDKIRSSNFDKTKRLYAATIQTMQELYLNISPGFFDLIIMDECHRSIYNKWQDILAYFDSIQVGLTATPSETIDRDTFRFFDCENQTPAFNYS